MNRTFSQINNMDRASLVAEKALEEQDIPQKHQSSSERVKEPRQQGVRRPLEVTTPKQIARAKKQVQTYEPPPIFTTTSVFIFGAIIIILTSIWTPLALIFLWAAARFQRYCFRINDEPSTRRRLLKSFQRIDRLTAPLRQVPHGIKVEESYWVNRRYVRDSWASHEVRGCHQA